MLFQLERPYARPFAGPDRKLPGDVPNSKRRCALLRRSLYSSSASAVSGSSAAAAPPLVVEPVVNFRQTLFTLRAAGAHFVRGTTVFSTVKPTVRSVAPATTSAATSVSVCAAGTPTESSFAVSGVRMECRPEQVLAGVRSELDG